MNDSSLELPLPLSEQPILLHELNHRISNEFACIIGFVSHAAARSGNEEGETALTRISELLHKHVEVHRALERPEQDTFVDAAAYLERLCSSISRSRLDHMKISMVAAVSPLRLQSDHRWRLGMIVYELITNAARHRFQQWQRGDSA
jgi:two-component sensor histidine kinase